LVIILIRNISLSIRGSVLKTHITVPEKTNHRFSAGYKKIVERLV
jgi:hypothetical protein